MVASSYSNVDRSRFVRRDRSSPVKKNVQIFLVVYSYLVLVCAERRRPRPLKSKQTTPAAQMGVAKSDFSQMCLSRSNFSKNAEHFAWIDPDRSRFEKENQYIHSIAECRLFMHCWIISNLLLSINESHWVRSFSQSDKSRSLRAKRSAFFFTGLYRSRLNLDRSRFVRFWKRTHS